MSTEELFIDFTKIPNELENTKPQSNASILKTKKPFANQQEEFNQKTRNNRFASVAPPDLAHINTISEVIKVTLSEEAATNPATQIKFSEVDLSRIINKVIFKLNLIPGDEPLDEKKWNMNDLEGINTHDLKKMIKMQNLYLDEIGKSMQTISKQNADLIASNKKLVQDRIVAYQSRDDLHRLLQEKEKLLEPKDTIERTEVRRNIARRLFFDETAILDAALQEFRQRCKSKENNEIPYKSDIEVENSPLKPSRDIPEKKVVSFIKSKEAFEGNSQSNSQDQLYNTILETADLVRVQKLFEPASSLSVQLNCTYKSLDRNVDNPYKNVRIGTPKRYPESNFTCGHIESLKKHLSHYVHNLSTANIQNNKELMEAISIETYISKIHQQLRQLSESFQECLDVLAEEKSLSRQLRLKIERFEKSAKSRKSDENNQMYFKKKRDLANILLPISRPSTAVEFENIPVEILEKKDPIVVTDLPIEEQQQTRNRATTACSTFPGIGQRKVNRTAKQRPSTTPVKTTSIYIPSIKVGMPFGSKAKVTSSKNNPGGVADNIIPSFARDTTQVFATTKPIPSKQAKVYLETLLT
ncbi:hypothetical protein HDV06_005644 [Boothiomyces sp. JEL0866]|nr:hypothetical protein HDV06_005644 [Boothiomyces sp. JEL0866]